MAGYSIDLPCNEDIQPQHETPMVFQCENCRTILGDSSNLIHISEALAIITIKAVQPCQVKIHEKYEKSGPSEVLLAGSLFQRVYCMKCSQEVGKVFTNLPSSLSNLSGQISLDVHKISSYEIPNVNVHKQDNFNDIVMKIQNDISKIQVVLINMNQRLESIENSLAFEEDKTE